MAVVIASAVPNGRSQVQAQTPAVQVPNSLVVLNAGRTNVLILAPPPAAHGGTNLLWNTNLFRGLTNRWLFKSPSPQNWPGTVRPRPGIYEAAPYTGIVVVPGPHPDDRALIGEQSTGAANLVEPELRTPIIVPELRLIPRGQK